MGILLLPHWWSFHWGFGLSLQVGARFPRFSVSSSPLVSQGLGTSSPKWVARDMLDLGPPIHWVLLEAVGGISIGFVVPRNPDWLLPGSFWHFLLSVWEERKNKKKISLSYIIHHYITWLL